ncbi:uncharacterized protein LOC128193578 [Vigna angularis]|uniref:uncharacterized protein LOC128193451 n=1 Tax=Phaseolus angularis TaxID=3914 RepID=UPI0022B2BF6A|nr:uncharacterized protein LOC128193451 [Vigna angularis]XP_052723304.1 uncharacterized protein LOC128193578 [Vigna angularis]
MRDQQAYVAATKEVQPLQPWKKKGESCWKNLEELLQDLGEVKRRASGAAATNLGKVDSRGVLDAASREVESSWIWKEIRTLYFKNFKEVFKRCCRGVSLGARAGGC